MLEASRAAALTQADAQRATEKAEQAASDLDKQTGRLQRATHIHHRFHGAAPAGISDQDELSQKVTAALAAWQSAPQPRPLTGPTAADLRAQIDALPEAPDGDTSVDATVRRLVSTYQQAVAVADSHDANKPADEPEPDPQLAAAVAAGPALVRELASNLAALAPQSPAADAANTQTAAAQAQDAQDAQDATGDDLETAARALQSARDRQQQTAEAAERAQRAADEADSAHRAALTAESAAATRKSPAARIALFSVAGITAIVGLVLIVAGQPIAGAVALTAAAAALGGAIATKPHRATSTANTPTQLAADQARRAAATAEEARRAAMDAERDLAAADGRHTAALAAARRTASLRAEITAQCAAHHLPDDANTLRTLAARADRVLIARDAVRRWAGEAEQIQAEVTRSEQQVRHALTAHGVPSADDPTVPVTDSITTYEHDCAARAEQAIQAQRRSTLEQALADRTSAETAAADALATRDRAHGLLRRVATETDVSADPENLEPAQLTTLLETWQQQHTAQIQQAEADAHEWAELMTLLDGATLDELHLDSRRAPQPTHHPRRGRNRGRRQSPRRRRPPRPARPGRWARPRPGR